MRASEPYLIAILYTMIPLSVILDIAVWRRLHLARLIVYFEIVQLAVLLLCPLDFGDFPNLSISIVVIITYLAFSSYDGKSNIAFLAIYLLKVLVYRPLVTNKQLSALHVLEDFFVASFTFMLFSGISMLVSYIVQIHGRLAKLLVENLNLLNGMDEGLAVVSAADKSITFASTPVV